MSECLYLDLADIGCRLVNIVVLKHRRLLAEGVAGDEVEMLNAHGLGVELGCRSVAEGV